MHRFSGGKPVLPSAPDLRVRHVHVEPQAGMPAHHAHAVLERPPHDPVAQIVEARVLLEPRHEAPGQHLAVGLAAPAQKRLGAHEAAVAGVHDGLVAQREPREAPRHARAHGVEQLQVAPAVALVLVVEEHELAVAHALRLRHGAHDARADGVLVAAEVAHHHRAARHAQRHEGAVHGEVGAGDLLHARIELGRLRLVGLGHDERELRPVHAVGHAAAAHLVGQALAEGAQQAVAERVAVYLVDVAELVHPPRAARAGDA